MKRKGIIGRIEKVDFPALHLYHIVAKVDTGADSSALHCHIFKETKEKGQKLLLIEVLDPFHPQYNKQAIPIYEYSKTKVKNSEGRIQVRYSIKTKVKIGRKKYTIDLTLTDRRRMKYPVLLGRKILNKRFLVDVSKEYLITK